MLNTILSDFSRVILDVRDKTYKGTLNGLYRELISNGKAFNFFDYFELNNAILDLFMSLKSKYSINIFTTGTLQRAPQISGALSPVFDNIFVAEELGLDKKVPASYIKIAEFLNKNPEEIYYIDDQAENINAAKMAGLSTHLYSDFTNFSSKIAKELYK